MKTMFSHFITFSHPNPSARLSDADGLELGACIRSIRELTHAHLLTPVVARDPYIDDGQPPMLTLQLCFEQLEALEQAASARAHGELWRLSQSVPASLAGAEVTQQVMLTRSYPVPTCAPEVTQDSSCSFLVHYPGEPRNLSEWLTYYVESHVPLMCRFPAVRAVEMYTRVDWIDHLPWQRVNHFQRNKIVFDSPLALESALHSPVREQMKADRAHFPPFSGGNVHFPFTTETITSCT